MKIRTKLTIITALMSVFFLIFPLLENGYLTITWADKLQAAIILTALIFSFSLVANEGEGE